MTNTPKTVNSYEDQFQRKYGDYQSKFEFGSNPSAELWNGRLAMIGFLAALIVELTTGQSFLHFLGF
ncbi:MAG TPA: chlorophyll a/b-binding protein [Coleofasciculaceae cyanobacterium]|jgi:uncharacterized protein YdiU (UPF0061 family)